jgi:hypothetical protein
LLVKSKGSGGFSRKERFGVTTDAEVTIRILNFKIVLDLGVNAPGTFEVSDRRLTTYHRL